MSLYLHFFSRFMKQCYVERTRALWSRISCCDLHLTSSYQLQVTKYLAWTSCGFAVAELPAAVAPGRSETVMSGAKWQRGGSSTSASGASAMLGCCEANCCRGAPWFFFGGWWKREAADETIQGHENKVDGAEARQPSSRRYFRIELSYI